MKMEKKSAMKKTTCMQTGNKKLTTSDKLRNNIVSNHPVRVLLNKCIRSLWKSGTSKSYLRLLGFL